MTDLKTGKGGCGSIAGYMPLIQATDGLTLGQVCALSGLEPSTIQNWIKRGFVPHPVGKKYRERHLARVLLIDALRESMQIDRVGALLCYLNGDTDDESDDIIAEEDLYDLFLRMTEQLADGTLSPEMAGQAADAVGGVSEENREKLSRALVVMAHVYAANRYKREADKLFNEWIHEV